MTDNPFANQIYLAGSFHSFRDKIIKGAPSKKFVDPRLNRQHAMYATNQDDLESAVRTPIIAVCLVNGKTPGTMTFVELGAAWESNSKIIVADERENRNDELGKWIKAMSYQHFDSIDTMTEFLEDGLIINDGYSPTVHPDRLDKVTDVFFAGNLKHWLGYVADTTMQLRTDLEIHKLDSNNFEKFYQQCMHEGDLVVVHFPQNLPIDRQTCFLMGGALYKKIPIIGKMDAVAPYPPLIGGLFRRTFNDHIGTLAYLQSITTNDIGRESGIMYPMFPRDGA